MLDIRNSVVTMPSRGFVILPLGSWSTKPPTGVQCRIAPHCIDASKRAAAGVHAGLVTCSVYANLGLVMGMCLLP